MPDSHANFAYSTVLTPPSPSSSGTSLTVRTGDGVIFPLPAFNAIVCPVNAAPLIGNAEVIRVTAAAGDVFTIARTQEGSNARAIQAGDQIYAAITAKSLTDAEGLIPIGAIQLFGGGAAPINFLVCDGTVYLNSAYPALAAVLGTTFGGDSTHFGVPDLKGRVPMGAGVGAGLTARTLGQKLGEELHSLTADEVPPHTHPVNIWSSYVTTDHYHSGATGAADRSLAHAHSTTVSGGTAVRQYDGGASWHAPGQAPGFPNTGSAPADGDATSQNGVDHLHGFTTPWQSTMHSSVDGTVTDPNHRHAINGSSDASSGRGTGHNVVQPYVVLNYIIRAK